MNQLKCEMCGSTDIVKQDGMFVCQVCGTKYSVEEAKKLMIEGTVEVTGTVKIDTTDELAKLYVVARRAKNDENKDDAIRYYDKILEKDPTSWEANFYVVYFKSSGCTIGKITSTASALMNCLSSTLTLIKDNVPDKKDQVAAVKQVAEHTTELSQMFYSAARNVYVNSTKSLQLNADFRQQHCDRCCAARNIMYFLGDNIEKLFGDYEELKLTKIKAWQKGIQQHNDLLNYLANKETNKNTIKEYAEKIKKYDPNYSVPTTTPSQKGCYIATCVYGSYDCPEVWTLRRYRDNKLGASHSGRAFIRFYYAISPTLVKWFGNTKWFKKMWRGMLDKKVQKLQAQGYESTPYNDLEWRK